MNILIYGLVSRAVVRVSPSSLARFIFRHSFPARKNPCRGFFLLASRLRLVRFRRGTLFLVKI